MTEQGVRASMLRLLASRSFELPDPGAGDTHGRLLTLADISRKERVSVARLAEAHTDAVAILHEAGRKPAPDALYGVWGSRGAVVLDRDRGLISGSKPFCSGAGVVDRALVTAEARDGGYVLLDIDGAASPTLNFDLNVWSSPAMSDSSTGTATFSEHSIESQVGGEGWYLSRPGFWHGACGPAACWAGAVEGLVDHCETVVDDSHHARTHLGAMRSAVWAMRAMLDVTGREIDAAPDDVGAARYRALALRHEIERHSTEILDRFGRALGPRPFVNSEAIARRHMDAHLFMRQNHAERDLESLGRLPPRDR